MKESLMKDKLAKFSPLGQHIEKKRELIDAIPELAAFVREFIDELLSSDSELSMKYAPLFDQRVAEIENRMALGKSILQENISFTEVESVLGEYEDPRHLFVRTKDPAQIIDLSQHSQDYSPVPFLSPTTNLRHLYAKQSVMDSMVHPDFDRKNFSKSIASISEPNSLFSTFHHVSREEKQRAERAGEAPRRNIDFYRQEVTPKIQATLGQIFRGSENRDMIFKAICEYEIDISTESFDVYESAFNLPSSIVSLKKEVGYIASLPHPFFSRIAPLLENRIPKNPPASADEVIQLLKDDKYSEIETQLKALSELSDFLSSLRRISDYIISDGYSRSTFDEDSPAYSQLGWNLLDQKVSHYNDEAQVLNDSPDDHPTTLLTGSNMAGKSYGMKKEMYAQICAQSFGYAPCKAGNFHPYENIAFIDRADTDSGNNLSAFGKEVTLWNKAIGELENAPGKTLLFADEGFSTTSPEDQFRLLSAFKAFLQAKGAKVYFATHNNEFIDSAVTCPESGVYHYEISHNDKGEITFLHKLKEGPDESHAIEVAKLIGLPSSLIDTAHRYLEGQFDAVTPMERTFKTPERFSEEERERMKGVASGFINICPSFNELRFDYPNTENPELKWKYSGGHSGDDWNYTPLERPKKTSLFRIFSKDDDIKYSSFHLRFSSESRRSGRLSDGTTTFLTSSATNNPKEIFERRKMIDEVMEKGDIKEVDRHIQNLYSLMWLMNHNPTPELCTSFNTTLLESAHKQVAPDKKSLASAPTYKDAYFLTRLVEFSYRLQGLDTSDMDFSRMEDFYSIAKRINEDDHYPYGDTSELDEAIKIFTKKYKLKIKDRYNTKTELNAYITQEALAFYEAHKEGISPFCLFDFDNDEARKLFAEYQDIAYECSSFGGPSILYSIYHQLLSQNKPLEEISEYYRSFDSVYMHQVAHYIEKAFGIYFQGISSGSELLTSLKAEADKPIDPEEQFLLHHSHRRKYRSSDDFHMLQHELNRLRIPFELAEIVKTEAFSAVEFNTSGDINLKNAWSVNEYKDKQIRNSCSFNGNGELIKMITGTNMSGKTFHSKQVLWNVLFGHTIGYAPAESATMPIFDQVFYLDRVNSSENKSLSAFGTEATYWKEFFETIQQGENAFCVVDEAFSTTSPTYQAALTYAVQAEMLKNGQRMIIAGHNHDAIAHFEDANPKHASSYHFKTHVDDAGELQFDYQIQRGHAESQALKVAEKIGMSEEVLKIAQSIRSRLETKLS